MIDDFLDFPMKGNDRTNNRSNEFHIPVVDTLKDYHLRNSLDAYVLHTRENPHAIFQQKNNKSAGNICVLQLRNRERATKKKKR